jgi:aminoglycoside phosphotransferase (APT) family kinase protein
MTPRSRSASGWFLPLSVAQPAFAATPPPLRRWVSRELRALRNRRALAQACAHVPAILATLPPEPEAPPLNTWRVHRSEWTESDVAVISVGPPGAPAALVLKLARADAGATALRRQSMVLGALRAAPALGAWRSLLPAMLSQGEVDGHLYSVEGALPGRDMRRVLSGSPGQKDAVLFSAAEAIAELHRRTARPVLVDPERVDQWTGLSLRTLRTATGQDGQIARLSGLLVAGLVGRALGAGWIHGDFWPGNLLVAPDGTTVTGIVDWDLAAPDELPTHDLLNLVVSTRQLAEAWELGDIVRMWLQQDRRLERERALIRALAPFPLDDPAFERAIVLLFWLRFVASYIGKSPNRAGSGWWMAKNVDGVLRSL